LAILAGNRRGLRRRGTPVYLIDEVVAQIRDKPADEQRRFARALRASFIWSDDEQGTPIHPDDVSANQGLPLTALMSARIVLGRRLIFRYTSDLTLGIPEAAMNAQLTAGQYRHRMGREIATVGNTHVLCYSEVSTFFGYRSELEVPASLRELLK
jgi:hypothetical protein